MRSCGNAAILDGLNSCRTGVIFCVFQGEQRRKRGKRETCVTREGRSTKNLARASLSPMFAYNTQKNYASVFCGLWPYIQISGPSYSNVQESQYQPKQSSFINFGLQNWRFFPDFQSKEMYKEADGRKTTFTIQKLTSILHLIHQLLYLHSALRFPRLNAKNIQPWDNFSFCFWATQTKKKLPLRQKPHLVQMRTKHFRAISVNAGRYSFPYL